jgi:hypothetical protein
MNLTLHLSPDIEARLREQTQATGKSPERLAIEALEEKLALETVTSAPVPPDEWQTRFRDWISKMPHGNPDADLSRDSVYEGRGE